jgi:GntR family transcriptional regulator
MLLDPEKRITLDRKSPVPLYFQIFEIISDYMKQPDAIGRKLPTEEAMMKIFDVSRATVRRAIQALESTGQISKMRGRRTVVANMASQELLTTIRSFTDQMRIEKHVPITKVVDVRHVTADLKLAELLDVAEGDNLLRLTRLRGNEEIFPLALFISYLTEHSGLTGEEDFEGSLYQLLREKGTAVTEGDAVIEARLAEGSIARLLEVDVGAPILYYERVGQDTGKQIVEYVQCWYVGSHYKFKIHLNTQYSKETI